MSNPKLLYAKHGVTPLCNRCYGDLHYLTDEDKNRLRGRITLYCIDCGTKHFSEASSLDAWAKDVKEGRAPRPVKPAPQEESTTNDPTPDPSGGDAA